MHADFLRYAWGSVMISHFGNTTGAGGAPLEVAGVPVLEFYGFEGLTAWGCLAIEGLFFLVSFLAVWAALQWKRLERR